MMKMTSSSFPPSFRVPSFQREQKEKEDPPPNKRSEEQQNNINHQRSTMTQILLLSAFHLRNTKTRCDLSKIVSSWPRVVTKSETGQVATTKLADL